MGMFDSLVVRCPKCSKLVEFQSKAGKCCLYEYTLNDVPPEIAGSLNGKSETCECGRVITIKTKVFIYVE